MVYCVISLSTEKLLGKLVVASIDFTANVFVFIYLALQSVMNRIRPMTCQVFSALIVVFDSIGLSIVRLFLFNGRYNIALPSSDCSDSRCYVLYKRRLDCCSSLFLLLMLIGIIRRPYVCS